MSGELNLKSTLNLPKTDFSMKANLPVAEPKMLDWWEQIGVYRRILDEHRDDPAFVLHDGPPYANGSIHLGQALNKILKDVIVKSRSMMGYRCEYIPGWDCHGLPIEHRVDQDLGPAKLTMSPLQVRARCRAYAEGYIDVQRQQFRRLGVFWDWETDRKEEKEGAPTRSAIYRTIDREYEGTIVDRLGSFLASGAVYYGQKPVHWCPSCRTALAEAEVEYRDHSSPSIYVAFPAQGLASRFEGLEGGLELFVLIWTTTPWTLPANLAVCLHPDFEYVIARHEGRGYLVAERLLPVVAEACGWESYQIAGRAAGREIVGEGESWVGASLPIERPYPAPNPPADGPGLLLLGNHVTLEQGTGCVHTAPGHGAEDFYVGQEYGLEPFNPVDDDGRFVPEMVGPDFLKGKPVEEANEAILEDLRGRGLLLSSESYAHQYPHCWRCHNPILFRATPQWFISVDHGGLRGRALAAIAASRWIPGFGEERIHGMVETRPDWCISRQRTWGVPIPVVLCTACFARGDHQAVVRDPSFFARVAALVREHGSDVWFGAPDGEGGFALDGSEEERRTRLLPPEVSCPSCGQADHLAAQDVIVDVWFESGVSHEAVLGRPHQPPWPADLYLEGHDQYRGWFQSSLLVGVEGHERAPFGTVLTHGFTLTQNAKTGRPEKMSKSLGNAISPVEVAEERGAEILRLWVSQVDFLEDMILSDEILARNTEAYRKIRNTFRFLLGNLYGFDPATDRVPLGELLEIDAWILGRFEELRGRLVAAYEAYELHRVYHGLHQFCGVTLSNFYLDVLKDRLYTAPPASKERRSAQTALYLMAEGLCRLMAPIVCFTAEEVWKHIPGDSEGGVGSVHEARFPEPLALAPEAGRDERWSSMLALRDEVARALEQARRAKLINDTLEAVVRIELPGELRPVVAHFGEDLRFLFKVAHVAEADPGREALASEAIPGLRVGVLRSEEDKCPRCWNREPGVGNDAEYPEVCPRCADALRVILGGQGGTP